MSTVLAQYVWRAGIEYSDAVRSTFVSEEPTVEWDTIELPVAGRPTPFQSLRAGDVWVAVAEIEGSTVGVHARGSEHGEFGLIPIPDLVAYLDDTGQAR
jgi:hypothetical protein